MAKVSARWLPCVLVLAVGLGCTSAPAAKEPLPSSPPSTPSPQVARVGFNPPAALVDRVGTLDQAPRARPALHLPEELDITDALTSPTLAEGPISRAVLMAQVSLFSQDPAAVSLTEGVPYLLSAGGEWRRVSLGDYGFATTYGEMGAALSPDGRRLAVNDIDRRTMAIVEVATGSFVRYRVPAREAITLKWSPDSQQLSFSDRSRNGPDAAGWTLDTSTGAVTETPFQVWFSEHDTHGNIWELTARGTLRRWRDGRLTRTVPLAYPDLGGAYPLAAGHLFAVAQFRRTIGGRPAPRGVAVFDPHTGELVRFLDLGGRVGWTRPLQWLDTDTLLLADGRSGRIWTWQVRAGRTRTLAGVVPRGTDLRVP